MKHRWLSTAFAATVVLSTSALAINPGGGGGGSNAATRYATTGSSATTSHSGGSSCTIYRPSTLGSGHPVIIWGNGTGSSPSSYAAGLRHLASWGFVVAAANTSSAGTGAAMLSCIDWLASSSISGNLNLSRIGTSGHSQGGGGAIMAGRDDRIDTTAPMQPYVVGLGHVSSSQSQQNGPMLLLSGGSDTIASPARNQQPVFDRANVPVFWASRNGASHLEASGDFGDFRGITTAWFLAQLREDATARALFYGSCSMCNASGWTMRRKGF
ncbi:MAG: alpha/beta hydrolase [Candidatus Obscuribacterales bacterium]|nr:alpha/beta hydrolase [Steroidobacteraceae bacterium]